ncbi:leucyl aminopeptidase family protein [Stakelama marina]|uniref:Leucyl aminopeptidase family protein n=1 Tax=Stakelama marina TaxID=2826939 RepID=A0A8T4IA42_9SPHN|nr:leucyl aminopeptidase family protein [Stakelama marina]MBR0551400.1 leucyl aminopeptidase family protein [Stakelama marina]
MTDYAKLLKADNGQSARTIHLVDKSTFDDWLKAQPQRHRTAVAAQKLTPTGYASAILPGDGAEDWSVVSVVANVDALSPWCLAKLGETLPEGTYRLAEGEPGPAMFGWLTAQYRFTRYKDDNGGGERVLLTGEPARIEETVRLAEATAKVRDLINTPAGDLGPAQLEAAIKDLGETHGATVGVIQGRELERDYPMIHAVGQAAGEGREPRLIELEWGRDGDPRIAIVGKGVCFDSGGLDIKPAAGMKLMKKDMGGSAHAIALAGLVMAARLPVRLHLLVPAVENSVSGNAFRPGDVLRTRKGLTVENTNTDAEGRLILGDALAKAGESNPELIVDFATLTGAARVALGPDLPATFIRDEDLASQFQAAADAESDPIWRMPLWDAYDEMLKSDIADLVNAPEGGFAGAVTAALFLRRFVPEGTPWAHLDVFGWRPSAKPGRPKGGEAYALRAAYRMLKDRYDG